MSRSFYANRSPAAVISEDSLLSRAEDQQEGRVARAQQFNRLLDVINNLHVQMVDSETMRFLRGETS